MRRFFAQNIVFLLLVNLIVKPIWVFAIDRNVQIAVGHATFGQYQALFNLSIMFQIMLDFGLQSYNNKTISRSPQLLPTLFPNIVGAKIILSFIYLIFVLLLGILFGYKGFLLFLLMLLSGVSILNSFVLYLRSNVSAMQKFKADSLLSVTDRLFMIGICSVLLFVPFFRDKFKIEWFVYAQLTAYFITGIIGFIMCTRISRFHFGNFNLKKTILICKQSFPYAILIFLMAIYIRSDIFLIERLLPSGSKEAGVYAAAYRLLDVANNVTGVLFAGMLLPLFGNMLAAHKQVMSIVHLCVNLLFPFAIISLTASILWGNDIMYLLYSPHATSYDGKVFTLLMFSFPFFCIANIFSPLLTANGNIRILIRISILGVLINLILNFILIKYYGAMGAAITCIITQLFIAIANVIVSRKKFGFIIKFKSLITIIIFLVTVFITGYGFQLLFENIWIGLPLFFVSGILIMILTGFLDIKKIRNLF